MADLAINTTRMITLLGQDSIIKRDVAASIHIFQGTACSYDAGGDLEHLDAADPLAGFAIEEADNSSGTDGAITCKVARRGILHGLTIATIDGKDHIGDTIYMSDSATFTATSSSNTAIGKVVDYHTDGTCDVLFEAAELRSV